MVGTAPGEIWRGSKVIRAALKAQADLAPRIRILPGEIVAFEEGSMGWAFDDPTLVLDDGRSSPARVTFVFRRETGAWIPVHVHSSSPVTEPEFWGFSSITMEDIARFVEHERPNLAPVTSVDGTTTIVFTDLEASTATNEALGDDRFLPLLFEHNDLVRARTGSAGGSVVKSQGDGFMLAFSSARAAVDAAIAVQRGVAGLDERLSVRMGVHTGEPVRRADDFYGRDVAYAARLGAAAIGGEILVSSLVKSLVEPAGSVRFDGPRNLELKGFDGPQPVFEVVWR
jgi:class 3 adenylate cyclase